MLKFLVFQRITWIKSADLEWNINSLYSATLAVALSIYDRGQTVMTIFIHNPVQKGGASLK